MTWRSDLKSSSKVMILALPLAIGWTIYTAQPTPGNFLLGYIFSALGAYGDRHTRRERETAQRAAQLYNLVAYTVYLASEVLSAGHQGFARDPHAEPAD